MARRDTRLPAPFLQRLTLRDRSLPTPRSYPFTLPWLHDDFELTFTEPVTIIVGENGTGKSTLIEAIADLSGYSVGGGGKGYGPMNNQPAIDRSAALGEALRGSWLPKVTDGWFFRAETFFSVARYLDAMGSPTADFLSSSHGEGFLRFFEERMSRQGIYFLDEPESALSPKRQLQLLRILHRTQESRSAQVIMATHSPILMALPGAQLLEITHHGFVETDFRRTRHFQLYRDFSNDPKGFIAEALAEEDED